MGLSIVIFKGTFAYLKFHDGVAFHISSGLLSGLFVYIDVCGIQFFNFQTGLLSFILNPNDNRFSEFLSICLLFFSIIEFMFKSFFSSTNDGQFYISVEDRVV